MKIFVLDVPVVNRHFWDLLLNQYLLDVADCVQKKKNTLLLLEEFSSPQFDQLVTGCLGHSQTRVDFTLRRLRVFFLPVPHCAIGQY